MEVLKWSAKDDRWPLVLEENHFGHCHLNFLYFTNILYKTRPWYGRKDGLYIKDGKVVTGDDYGTM